MANKKSVSYKDYLITRFKDPEEAIGCLNAALEGGDIRVFLLALQDVIRAQGGFTEIARRTNKSRTSLYKTISKHGNPYLETTNDILSVMGMRLKVVANDTSKRRIKRVK